MRKKLFICILVFSYTAFCFAAPSLHSVSSEGVHYGEYGPNSVQYITTDQGIQISVSADFSSSGGYVKYFFNIQNKSNKTYHFNENNILAYEGNYETNEWYTLPYKTASKFYADKKNDLEIGAVILGAITLGALITSDLDIDIDLNVSTPLSLLLPSVHVSLFDPDPILTGLALANLFYLMDVKDNVDSLEYLEQALLYSTDIKPNEQYTGVIFVPEGKGPDYRVNLKVSPYESYSFTFARSDRDNILNPWSDKDFMVAVMGGFNVPNITGGSIYSIVSGKRFGGYFGCSFFFEGANKQKIFGTSMKEDFSDLKMKSYDFIPDDDLYDFRFVNQNNILEDSFGMYTGLTTKLVPHFYLMTGVGIQFSRKIVHGTYEYCNTSDSESQYIKWQDGWLETNPEIYFVPQIGINVAYGILDFATVFDYVISKGSRVNLLFGFSF